MRNMNWMTMTEVLRRQYLVVIAVLLAGIVLFGWAQHTLRKYAATSTILAVAANSNNSATLDPQKDPTSAALSPQDIPTLLTSTTILTRVAADLGLDPSQAQTLAGKIKARNSLDSDVIPITFTSREPKQAVLGANALTNELVRYDRQITTSRYDGLVSDLTAQLARRRAALHDLDTRITALTAQDPSVSVDAGTAPINQRLTALEQQRDQVQTTMDGDTAAAAIAALRPGLARQAASHEIIANDPVFTALRAQLGKDMAALYLEKAGYTDKFPGLSGLQDQVSRERVTENSEELAATASPAKSTTYVGTLLDANKANAALASDRAQLASIDGEIADASSHLVSSQQENTSIEALRRERLAGDQAYSDLSARLSKAIADRAQAAAIDSIIVIDQANSAQRSLLSRPTVLAAAIGAAFLWLAVTLAFIVDAADARLRTPETIEDVYGRPVFKPVG